MIFHYGIEYLKYLDAVHRADPRRQEVVRRFGGQPPVCFGTFVFACLICLLFIPLMCVILIQGLAYLPSLEQL